MRPDCRAALALLALLCCPATLAETVLKPAFEDVTLTGDLNAKILAGGPMIAYTTPREVGIWVSTAKEARVRIAYYDEDAVEKVRVTAEVETAREDSFTVLFRCDRVEPGRTYFYKLYIDGKTFKLPFKRRFSTPELSGEQTGEERLALLGPHAVNDVLFPPRNPVSGYEAITPLMEADPTAVLWVGNSTLVREADRSAAAGLNLRYAFARNWEDLRPLQATVPQYAAPGADDLGRTANGWAALPLAGNTVFDRFWPVAGRASKQDLSYSFTRGDVAVFVLDAFTHRNAEQRYGSAQIDWLIGGLDATQNKSLRIVALGEPFTTARFRKESSALLKQLRTAAKARPILLTAPGTDTTVWAEHGEGLRQLVLGPFSRNPAPSALAPPKGQVLATGQVVGLLTWAKDQAPALSIRSSAGEELMQYAFP
ncbi:MAG: hypothetical protein AAGI24_13280 [Pseudomonadota bacterium]